MVIFKGQGNGKNARKRKLARVVASKNASARNGASVSRSLVVSGQDAARHKATMVAGRREHWQGASHDGFIHHGRTFIRRTTAEYMNGVSRLHARWSAQAGIVPLEKKGRK